MGAMATNLVTGKNLNRRLSALALLLALGLVGCGAFQAPAATPAAMDDVIANLVLRDVTVLRLVSGDPGCPTSSFQDNAVHLTLVVGAQSASHEVYLLRWKNQAAFDANASTFDDCVAEFQALGMGTSRLDVSPWRAYGPTWPAQLQTILEQSLRAAGGG